MELVSYRKRLFAVCPVPGIIRGDCGTLAIWDTLIPVSTADAIRRAVRTMPWSLPHRRGDGGRHVQTQHLVKNRILRQLSADELQSVQPWLTPIELRSGYVVHASGEPIDRVYFPLSGMISLLAVMQSGEAIETGIVGADGLVGGDAAINGHLFGQMTVQLDGAALTIPKAKFVDAYLAHPHLRNLVDRYQSILLVQAQ